MKKFLLLVPFVFVIARTPAADPKPIPEKSIAQKKELLFSDDFEHADAERVHLRPTSDALKSTVYIHLANHGQ